MATQTAIVTGSASGIGLAIARAFVDDGMNVVLNGRTEEKLARAASELDVPSHLAIVAGDITRPETAAKLVSSTVDRFGRLDVVVNNAGIFQSKPIAAYSIEELDGYLGYLRGTFLLIQAAVNQMRQQGVGGSIVNIGTILTENSISAVPSSAPIAAKGGILALTKNLSVELAGDNIRINAVSPGVVPTPLYGELTDEQLQSLHAMQPLGRYGTPTDIADAVLYVTNASWLTGVILPVDGGVAAGGDAVFHGDRKSKTSTAA